jgi:hypothetical protein
MNERTRAVKRWLYGATACALGIGITEELTFTGICQVPVNQGVVMIPNPIMIPNPGTNVTTGSCNVHQPLGVELLWFVPVILLLMVVFGDTLPRARLWLRPFLFGLLVIWGFVAIWGMLLDLLGIGVTLMMYLGITLDANEERMARKRKLR